jgi:hypothetical protein
VTEGWYTFGKSYAEKRPNDSVNRGKEIPKIELKSKPMKDVVALFSYESYTG